jgi:hypothetical protein
MNLKKDKAKILDEVWTEERIRGFLEIEPPAGVNSDFHTLLRAYQQMREDDFATFIDMFVAAGRNINARDGNGQSLLDIVSKHRLGTEFVATLRAVGAE